VVGLTLEDIGDEEDVSYPRALLHYGDTAAVLFAGAFYGKQDAYWLARAGARAVCVDTDGEKLEAMKAIYPAGWQFVVADVFDWVRITRRRFDVVSLDPYTSDMDRCAELLPSWCRLARRLVIIGMKHDTDLDAPDGWSIEGIRHRSSYCGGVYWGVLRPR
jgi:hypothetical protein